jgi:hypothetical protein
MPVEYLVYAILIAAIAPILVAIGAFFAALNSWIDKKLRFDPAAQQRLQLVISSDCITWGLAPAGLHRRPYAPLIYAVLAGLLATMVETAVFAAGTSIPSLWYRAGSVVSAGLLIIPFAVAILFSRSLDRFVDRRLVKRANANLTYADPVLAEIGESARLIDASYQSIGLRARTDVPALCKQALLGHAGHGVDSGLARLIGVKNRLEYDLRSVQYCAHLFMNALDELRQARDSLKEDKTAQESIEQIHNWIHSRDLADILEEARWPEAGEWLEAIRANLHQLLDVGLRGCTMPRSVEDAYRVLNVTGATPLNNVKAVVSAFQRVWHPDLVRDEVERLLCTLKMQQINVAWNLIQQARRAEQTLG